MEAAASEFRSRFADNKASLTDGVNSAIGLINDLLDKLDRTEKQLKQKTLDYDSECDARRRLQEEVQEQRSRLSRRPFVALVIDADGDGYVFRDEHILDGEKGGEDAADALLAALQDYTEGLAGVPEGVDFVVRAFANVGGLGAALEKDRRLKSGAQLRSFAAGFSNRQPFFDFVDVGSGKERADSKICSNIKLFAESPQCKHIVVACGHDTGYAPFLGQLVGDKRLEVADRMTLLEGTPFPAAIKKLGLKTTRFRSVFNDVASASGQNGTSGQPNNSYANVARSPTAPEPGPSTVTKAPPTGFRNPHAQSGRLGPLETDETGRRVDKPLQVDAGALERIRDKRLCFYLFLRGECVVASCKRNHAYQPLSDEEFDALWSLARKGRCKKNLEANRGGSDCSDPKCVYGHKAAQ